MRHLRDVIAVAPALGAARSYATASVMQQRAAQDERADEALKPGLLLRLVRQPLWLGGLAADKPRLHARRPSRPPSSAHCSSARA